MLVPALEMGKKFLVLTSEIQVKSIKQWFKVGVSQVTDRCHQPFVCVTDTLIAEEGSQ